MNAKKALDLALSHKPSTVLDIGAGSGIHTQQFLNAGCHVTAIDLNPPPFHHNRLIWVQTRYLPIGKELYDCVWCSHVLEHLPNVGNALKHMRADIRPNGHLAITVPPRKDALVGGHLSLWTPGLLVYRLVLAGFDCSRAAVAIYDYNISVIVNKDDMVPDEVLARLAHDRGDIETLAPYFPWDVCQGIDGFLLPEVNWRHP